MKKSIKILILVAIIAVIAIFPTSVFAISTMDIKSKSALLMSENGEVVFEYNGTKKLPIASMTKIMTLVCVYDAINNKKLSLEDSVTVSENAASMGGSQVFLSANSIHKVKDLIRSIVVCSANDSCVALAEHISGTASTFVDGMNNKASQLGLVATHFENCTGLPALNAYSCAIDVATIMRQLIKNKNYFECAHIWMQDYLHPDGRIIGMTNTNRLVKFYNGCDGGKTGYTNEAMHCLCATAKKSNTRFISVVIGAPDSKTRFAEVSSLFNYGFSNYENKVLVNKNTAFDKINVIGGKVNSLTIKAEKQLEVFTKKGESNIETLYDIPDSVKAPIEVGDCVGSAKAVRNGKTVAEIKLIATESIKEKSFLDWFKELVVK